MAFSFALNLLLEREAWARERLAPFAGRVVELRAPPFPALRFVILAEGTVEASGAEPALTMTLGPRLLAELARGEEHALRAVDVDGDARLARELLVLVRHLRPDFEEALSRLVGDVAAHRIGEAARALAAWPLDAARRLGEALADYATDERRLLVRRSELEGLAGEVVALRDALERLDKRIARLA